MVDLSEFESISPYTDAEAAEALSKLAEYPLLAKVSQQFFPEESPDFLKNILKQIKTIDQFKVLVMQKFVSWVWSILQGTTHTKAFPTMIRRKNSSRCQIIEISSWIRQSLSWFFTIMVFR